MPIPAQLTTTVKGPNFSLASLMAWLTSASEVTQMKKGDNIGQKNCWEAQELTKNNYLSLSCKRNVIMNGVANYYPLKFQRGKDGVKIKKGWQKPNKLPLFSKEVSLSKFDQGEAKQDMFPPQIHVHTMQSSLTLFRTSNLIRPHMGCSSFVFGLDSIVNLFTKGDVTRNNSQGQFLAQHSIATLLQMVAKLFQHCHAVLH